LQKNGKFDELDVFLYDVVDAIRVYTILLQPILTEGTKEMIKQMNFNDDMIDYANIASHNLIVNLKVNESSPIYNRIAIE
jgi:methionyl-tRNA synthetase